MTVSSRAPAAGLAPGARIGILGGGQLGRMLAIAAARLGYSAHILCPDPDSPAFALAAARTVADYGDEDALDAFAAAVDVVTYEFENVPLACAERLAAQVPVRPAPTALAVAQDRLSEKRFLAGLDIATAAFAPVDGPDAIERALADIGAPALLKSRRLGYDGKGQAAVAGPRDADAAWRAIGEVPAILEAHIAFDREVSLIVARGLDGTVEAYDPVHNEHRDGILWRSRVPAPIDTVAAANAVVLAVRIAEALDHVGVLALELFQTGDGWLANEIAPRVHNSGHWTIDACACDQFEQHIRAIAGLPLGDPDRFADAEMTNLIGDEIETRAHWLAMPGSRLHLYGKAAVRPGRKMGHVTRLSPLTRGAQAAR